MKRPVLNRLLALEAAQRTTDGAGGYTEVWSALGQLWAEIKLRTGRERDREGAQISKVDYRITVRVAEQGSSMRPNAGQRFREGTRAYRITAVADASDLPGYLTCFATEEAAA